MEGINENKFLGGCILAVIGIITAAIALSIARDIPKPETVEVFFNYLFDNTESYMTMLFVTIISCISCAGSAMAGIFIAVDYFKRDSIFYEDEVWKLVLVGILSVVSFGILIVYIIKYLVLLLIAPICIVCIIRAIFESK